MVNSHNQIRYRRNELQTAAVIMAATIASGIPLVKTIANKVLYTALIAILYAWP